MKNPHVFSAFDQSGAPIKKCAARVPSRLDPQLLKVMREEIRIVAKEALGEAIRDDLKTFIHKWKCLPRCMLSTR